jgi:hypothetical protein
VHLPVLVFGCLKNAHVHYYIRGLGVFSFVKVQLPCYVYLRALALGVLNRIVQRDVLRSGLSPGQIRIPSVFSPHGLTLISLQRRARLALRLLCCAQASDEIYPSLLV